VQSPAGDKKAPSLFRKGAAACGLRRVSFPSGGPARFPADLAGEASMGLRL